MLNDISLSADPSLLLISNDGSTCQTMPSRRYCASVTTGRRTSGPSQLVESLYY
jgi:hypothetical protein